jgi:hypothetical protein
MVFKKELKKNLKWNYEISILKYENKITIWLLTNYQMWFMF